MIALKAGRRAVLMFGWEKKDMKNIRPNEMREYRDLAKCYLGFTEEQMNVLVRDGLLVEISQPR